MDQSHRTTPEEAWNMSPNRQQILQIPLTHKDEDEGYHVAIIPFPMTEEDFTLILDTLSLWKERLTKDTHENPLTHETP